LSHCKPLLDDGPVASGDALDSGSCLTAKDGTPGNALDGGIGDKDADNPLSGVLPLDGSVELGPGVVENSNESAERR
jgi:hypothetical protein